jgi:transportin-3
MSNNACQIVYDLHQVPRAQLPDLRASIMRNLATFHAGPKPIRLQLCVCLANLAIQMTEWKDVLRDMVSALGTDPATLPCVLDFLRVLPEEVTHGRKIALTVRSTDPQPTLPCRHLRAVSTLDIRVTV